MPSILRRIACNYDYAKMAPLLTNEIKDIQLLVHDQTISFAGRVFVVHSGYLVCACVIYDACKHEWYCPHDFIDQVILLPRQQVNDQ